MSRKMNLLNRGALLRNDKSCFRLRLKIPTFIVKKMNDPVSTSIELQMQRNLLEDLLRTPNSIAARKSTIPGTKVMENIGKVI